VLAALAVHLSLSAKHAASANQSFLKYLIDMAIEELVQIAPSEDVEFHNYCCDLLEENNESHNN
jgi:hypothetical protein